MLAQSLYKNHENIQTLLVGLYTAYAIIFVKWVEPQDSYTVVGKP